MVTKQNQRLILLFLSISFITSFALKAEDEKGCTDLCHPPKQCVKNKDNKLQYDCKDLRE